MDELLQYMLLATWIAIWFLALRQLARPYVRALLSTTTLPPILRGIAGFACYFVFSAQALVGPSQLIDLASKDLPEN